MKVLILLALVSAATAASLNSAHINERFTHEFKVKLLEKFGVIGPDNDLIPDLNATLPINDTRIEFNNELLIGFVELIDSIAYGLDTLVDDIDFNILLLKVSGTITIETVRVAGQYATDLIIHLPFVEPPFTEETLAVGAGDGDISAGGVSLTFSANLVPNFITDRVHITKLNADIVVTALHFVLENLSVDGALVNWDEVNADAVAWLQHLLDTQKPVLIETAQAIVNDILKDIPLSDIIGAVGRK